MRTQRTDTDAHSRALRIGMHDLTRLVVHLHLLLGIAIGLEYVNLRNHIVSQLVGELLDSLHLTLFYHLLILLLQFGHGSGTGTRSTLIRSHVDALDMREFLQRLEYHDHHDRCTIRVGNNTTGTVQGILGIALGHHQGYIVVHAESTGIVNHHSTVFRNCLGKFLRGASTGRGESDIHILEVIVVLQQLHFDFLTLKRVLPTCAAL